MEKEIVRDIQDEEDEEDEERVSRETPRRSVDSSAPRRSIDSAAPRRIIDSAAPRRSIDSTASSSKKRKKDSNKLKHTLSSDPFMDVFANVQGDLRDVTKHVGVMVASMQHEAEIQEKAMVEEDPLQKIQNEAILECQKLGLTGTEVVNDAAAFVKVPAQMSMLLALPESLRREYVLKILAGNSLYTFACCITYFILRSLIVSILHFTTLAFHICIHCEQIRIKYLLLPYILFV